MLLAAPLALATPTGKKWDLRACGTGMACETNLQCVTNRCQAVFKIATTIQNTGSMVLNGAQKVPYATVVSRMGEAFKNWTSPRINSCETSWNSVFGGTFSAPSGTAAISRTDTANNLIWLTGSNWRHGDTTLALTTVTSYDATGEIFDADIEFNNNIDWSDTAAAHTFDYESVVVHEAGHFLGLDHNESNANAVMWRTVTAGSIKRALGSADIADVCTVYPGDTGAQGVSCMMQSQCTGSRVCESAAGGTDKICTADCTGPSDLSCPTGYSCQASSLGFACLSAPGSSDLCSFCTTGSDCATGVCVTDRSSLWCSLSCSSDAQCGTGYHCDDSNFCVPNTSCSMQCEGSGTDQCAVGFSCQSGTCRPTGLPGDRCEVLGSCGACSACVFDASNTNIAFCRSCCGGTTNGGLCQGCSVASCGADRGCVGLANGKDQVCVPSSGSTVCQACSPTTPCQPGLDCISGRCHSACNPFAPASCAACFETGIGTGFCSCDDEIAHVNEPCGQNATELNACDNGLLCVPSPTNFCRTPCVLTDTNACRPGETCTNLSGKTVCLPSAVGNQCTACTAGNTCGSSQLSCYATRCYLTCNINTSGRCESCVQVDANGNGLCACDDQIVAAGMGCGLPAIAFCQPGTLCVESTCRAQCDPKVAPSTCPAGSECSAYSGSNYCIPPPVTGGGQGGGSGGGAGGGGGGRIDAGTGGGGVTNNKPICGCTSLDQGLLLGPLLMLAWARRKKGRLER